LATGVVGIAGFTVKAACKAEVATHAIVAAYLTFHLAAYTGLASVAAYACFAWLTCYARLAAYTGLTCLARLAKFTGLARFLACLAIIATGTYHTWLASIA